MWGPVRPTARPGLRRTGHSRRPARDPRCRGLRDLRVGASAVRGGRLVAVDFLSGRARRGPNGRASMAKDTVDRPIVGTVAPRSRNGWHGPIGYGLIGGLAAAAALFTPVGAAAKTALLVVGSTTLSASDAALKGRLDHYYTTTVRDDGAAADTSKNRSSSRLPPTWAPSTRPLQGACWCSHRGCSLPWA